MGYYFSDHLSMHAAGFQVQRTLEAITRRYIGANPPLPMTYRAFNRRGILRGKDYRYHADFSKIFPHAKPEQFVYAWSKYWSDGPTELKADMSCFGPTIVYLNGVEIFQSDILTERYPDQRHRISLPMQPGWNHLLLRFKKTRAGFGGIFGTWLGKHPYYFLMPTHERAGQEGWIFTRPMDRPCDQLPGPGPLEREKESGLYWLPENSWDAAHLRQGVLERIFGKSPIAAAIAWTQALVGKSGSGRGVKCTLTGKYDGPIRIFIQDTEVFRAKSSGDIDAQITLPPGTHDLMLQSDSPPDAKVTWGFTLTLHNAHGDPIPLQSPCNIQGSSDPWLYLGPFPAAKKIAPKHLPQLRNLHQPQPTSAGKETYWRLDAPDTSVRPYNENSHFGRWNYPLGVTLYGLLHAAQALGSNETQDYIAGHMQFCCDTFNLALFDKSQYGGATAFHSLLTSIDSLDDCGSFASALIEAAQHLPLKNYRPIADYVADYISNKQARLPDGAFFRKTLMHTFHENTLWADDLYMSVPFLCRYAQLTGDKKYLDDAARQVAGFKKRLFIPELKLMSHVFDFRRNLPTGIPWGRGNGWTLFSLSELLAVLPEKHPQRPALLTFFRELCDGLLPLQDDAGMWHQVLTHPDSYPETSCTAMFACAFARGIRLGWLADPDPFAHAVLKAWDALTRTSIDRHANIHGVCRGSEFSFSPEYYKKELLPNLNDTHGIGIVLLAGVEVLHLTDFLQSTPSRAPLLKKRLKPGKKSV